MVQSRIITNLAVSLNGKVFVLLKNDNFGPSSIFVSICFYFSFLSGF